MSRDELAGIACLPDAESRLVAGGRRVDEGGDDWEVEHGPFEEEVHCLLIGLERQNNLAILTPSTAADITRL